MDHDTNQHGHHDNQILKQQRTTQDLTKPPTTASMFPTPKRLEEPKLSDTNDPNDYEPVYICSYEMKCDDDPVFFSARNNDTSRFLFSFDLFRDGQCIVALSPGWVRDHNVRVYTCICTSNAPDDLPSTGRITRTLFRSFYTFRFFLLDCPFLLFQMTA